MKLTDTFIDRPVFTTMAMTALVLFGFLGYRAMGINRYPNVDFPTVSISTSLFGASPEVIESDVTDVLESQLNSIEGIRHIYSTSSQGSSQITIEFELGRTRWYWTDENVAQWSITYRVSYTTLTRQYRVASGPLGQAFESLEEVQRFISRVASRPVGRADALTRGTKYEAAVRFKLDVNQLPKPFQVNALASREWQLASEWQRWSFTP